jgi:hypothetical protein
MSQDLDDFMSHRCDWQMFHDRPWLELDDGARLWETSVVHWAREVEKLGTTAGHRTYGQLYFFVFYLDTLIHALGALPLPCRILESPVMDVGGHTPYSPSPRENQDPQTPTTHIAATIHPLGFVLPCVVLDVTLPCIRYSARDLFVAPDIPRLLLALKMHSHEEKQAAIVCKQEAWVDASSPTPENEKQHSQDWHRPNSNPTKPNPKMKPWFSPDIITPSHEK